MRKDRVLRMVARLKLCLVKSSHLVATKREAALIFPDEH